MFRIADQNRNFHEEAQSRERLKDADRWEHLYNPIYRNVARIT